MFRDLTIPEQTVLKQFIFGNRSLSNMAENMGVSVHVVIDWVERIKTRLSVPDINGAIEKAVRGGDYVFDFTPEDLEAYDRKTPRQKKIELRELKENICRYIADFHVREGVYATDRDVAVKFGVDDDTVRRILLALDRTCYIEIIRKNGEKRLRPLARP